MVDAMSALRERKQLEEAKALLQAHPVNEAQQAMAQTLDRGCWRGSPREPGSNSAAERPGWVHFVGNSVTSAIKHHQSGQQGETS
jgi:hypothetical protein